VCINLYLGVAGKHSNDIKSVKYNAEDESNNKSVENTNNQPAPAEDDFDEDNVRIFELNELNPGYPSNYIKTTKYNVITFIPLSLLIQFLRIANIYFLVISILALIPSISSITPLTAIAPLIFVLLVSMVREGIEDFYRYKSDRAANGTKVKYFSEDNTFEDCTSKDLKVGDIVLINGDDTFPADIILLKSSNGQNAFIQTSSLDGEKNLKKRYVPKGIDKLTKPSTEQSYHLGGSCTTLLPDKDLHEFTGKLEIGGKNYALTIDQLLLKDAKLKNTSWIIGVVAFTGRQSKVMLNSLKSRIKTSNLEQQLNKVIIFLFAVQIFICFLLSCITAIYDNIKNDNQDYYLGNDNSDENVFLNFFSYFLLLSTLIPISLIVTLEVTKVIQCYFISQDAQMFDAEADAGTKVSSTTINEELGQVTYIFSDKTGTLTQNIMEFRALTVGQQSYGHLQTAGLTRQLSNVEKRKEIETSFY
jgi:phospholipid-translocating P-type ATPase (flippase)